MDITISIFRGIIGAIVLIGIAFLFSKNRKAVNWKVVGVALITDLILVNLILHTRPGQLIFEYMAQGVEKFMSFAAFGTAFVFGDIQKVYPSAFIFIALVPLIFFGAFMGLLYHFGIIQKIIKVISIFLIHVLKLSGVESTGIVSNVLVGQSETAVVLGPYLKKMSDSELFMIMTSGMASVAGTLLYAYYAMGANLSYVIAASILSAPTAVIMAKILFPRQKSEEEIVSEVENISLGTSNAIDAIAHGAMGGWKVAVAVGVMLVAFVSLIHLANSCVDFISFGYFTFDTLLGYLFTPVAYLIGVPTQDVPGFAALLGQKTFFNEFVAYTNLKNFTFTHKGFMMICFALTGFANLSSIAIQTGCYGCQDEGVRAKVVKFGLEHCLEQSLQTCLAQLLLGCSSCKVYTSIKKYTVSVLLY